MKVFSINCGLPQNAKRREFARLDCNQRVYRLLSSQARKGRPIQGWEKVEMYIDNPTCPQPDFFWSSLDMICNQQTRDIVGHLLEQSGELLPMTIKGEQGIYYFFNPTPALDTIDPEHSIWDYSKQSQRSVIRGPAFRPNRLSKVSVFLEQTRRGNPFCVERTGDHRDGEFKALVEKHGLTGLSFDLVWSEAEGPTLPTQIWGPNDPFEYRRHDGTPWVFPKSKLPSKKPVTKLVKTARPSAKKQKRASK